MNLTDANIDAMLEENDRLRASNKELVSVLEALMVLWETDPNPPVNLMRLARHYLGKVPE